MEKNEVKHDIHENGSDKEEDEERVMTLSDVLREDAMALEAADAVLGDSSTTDCSYPLGYLRQPIYACRTCIPEPSNSQDISNCAGICLACSYNCHENHELIELYTKRNFRCDCGNKKFPSKCQLIQDKADYNTNNLYSQNFNGHYCICHRPYPDPEATSEEIMIQCIICEDWLHDKHLHSSLDSKFLPSSDFSQEDEVICGQCMEKHPYLAYYIPQQNSTDETKKNSSEETNEITQCILEILKEKQKDLTDDAMYQNGMPTFWNRNWREQLCRCSSCVNLFEKEKINFLLDVEDSLFAYEKLSRQADPEDGNDNDSDTNSVCSSSSVKRVESAAQKAFESKLTHQQQVEMAIGYNHMKSKLQGFLANFVAENKTVKKEDITGFFAQLEEAREQQTKRQRTS